MTRGKGDDDGGDDDLYGEVYVCDEKVTNFFGQHYLWRSENLFCRCENYYV